MSGSESTAMSLLAEHFGRSSGALTSCGSAAIEVALRWLSVGPGDEVVLPDTGCYKIGAAVLRAGAVPVFTGVGQRLVLSSAAVRTGLTPRTRCVVAVHQFGLPCPVGQIRSVLPDSVAIVEDAAQAWGTVSRGQSVGRAGDLVVTSFGPSKPVPVGAGGAVLGDDVRLSEWVSSDRPGHRLLTNPPTPAPFPTPLLDELVRQLGLADRMIENRRRFVASLRPLFDEPEYRLPWLERADWPSWHRLPVWCASIRDRDRLMEHARGVGLRAQPEHGMPLRQLPMFRERSRHVPDSRPSEPREWLLVLSTDRTFDHAKALIDAMSAADTVRGRVEDHHG